MLFNKLVHLFTLLLLAGNKNFIILEFHDFLEKSFPVIHSSPQVTYEKINKFSLLYTVNGTDAASQPYILAGASSSE